MDIARAIFLTVIFSIRALIFTGLSLVSAPPVRADETIAIRGTQVAAEAVNAAAARIKKDTGLEFRIVTEGGSANAVASIGEEIADVALLSRKLVATERATWPDLQFQEVQFGKQALLIAVPEQVWNAGVRALTKEQLRAIYEGRVKTWKELGGEDRKLTFYNRDVRTSAWELFIFTIYGDVRKASPCEAEVLVEPSDVTTAVAFNGGAIAMLEFNAQRPAAIHALGFRLEDGTVAEPTAENIATGRYPLSRPLIIATSRKPAGKVRRFVEFMLGDAGQESVKKAGHVTNAEMARGAGEKKP